VADFKGLLGELAKGRGNLEAARTYIDEAMVAGTADPSSLVQDIEGAGLPGPIAGILKKQVSKYVGDADDPNKTVLDLGMSLEADPAHEKTQMTAPPTGGESDPFAIADANAKTQIIEDSHASDRTVVMDSDRTVVTDSDRTQQQGAGDFDPFAADSMRTQQPTGGTGGTAWPGRGSGGVQKQIGPGTILKDRFELISPLGEGGMGVVYKARDLLKVEAKDKNPYIAVKLLSGDFRNHPESFIALQRESSKAQRLAHPNIATVFDFDRDSGTVYMTMEILEGQELAKYIKKLPAGGLPIDEALKVIHQLADGLSYAHQRGLVHSDFKPGNAFILNDGTVKIMDFGIARASKTKGDAAGETTVFDPGQLGALTPAYATVEMFEGQDPAPPDDIYALACVAYELLTGKHPFNKLSAPKVLEKGLTPAPVVKPGWTKRQNKGLMKALALKREQRTQTVEEFWESIREKKDYTMQIAAASVALVVILGAALYTPIKEGFENRRDDQIVESIKQGGAAVIPGVLAQLPEYSDRSRFNILDKAKDPIIAYFEGLAQAQANYSSGKFNYAAGLKIIDDARKYYPDSAKLESIKFQLEADKAKLVEDLGKEWDGFLASKQFLLPTEDARDMVEVLETMRSVDPTSSLINDPRLMQEYGNLANQALAQRDYARADEILKVALAFAPKDATLLGINDGVQRELKRQADAQLVADIKKRLNEQRAGLTTLEAFAKARDDLLKLEELRPDDAFLADIAKPLAAAIDGGIRNAVAAKQWEQAEKMLFDYARLFSVGDLVVRRDELSKAEVNAGWAPTNQSAQNALVEERRATIKAALTKAAFDPAMDAALQKSFKELAALMRPGNAWFDEVRNEIVSAYLAQAGKYADADRFDAARRTLDEGERYAPGLDRFAKVRADIAAAEREYEAERQEELLAAAIKAKQGSMMNLTKNDVIRAEAMFVELKGELPPNDEWVKGEGLNALVAGFVARAKAAKEKNQATIAAQMVERGLQYAPANKDLKELQAGMAGEIKKEAVLQLASNATPQNARNIGASLAAARAALPQEAANIQSDVIGRLTRRIKDVESTDPAAANELWAIAKELFPSDATLRNLVVKSVPKPSVYAPAIRNLLAVNKLTEATAALNDAKAKEPGNDDLTFVQKDLDKKKSEAQTSFAQFRTAMAQGNRPGAQSALTEALRRWTDNPEFLDEQRKNFAVTTAPVKSADGSRPCVASLAGFGKQGRAECFDMPGGQKGPTMIVVPAGGGQPAFAIGKFEVSAAEYNAGCRASGKCAPLGIEGNLPATGMSLAQAQAYTAWLAEVSGKPYRIASEAEWVYAASAAGSATPGATIVNSANCRVMQGDQVLKGLSILDIKTGTANGWGMTNFVGNAQEFVLRGGAGTVRGGAFSDSLSTCSIDLVKNTNGAADPTTGFRVSRDLD
jgi:serine/threonine protein kinase